MNKDLLLNNISLDLNILIVLSIVLGCSIYYLILSKNTAVVQQNIEAFTAEEIEAIWNENAVNVVNADIDALTDSETEYSSDNESTGFDTDTDIDIATENILNDPNLFFMPNVDLNVCSIQELKFFEFSSLYAEEIASHMITDEDIMEFLSWFTEEQLLTNWINHVFYAVITII